MLKSIEDPKLQTVVPNTSKVIYSWYENPLKANKTTNFKTIKGSFFTSMSCMTVDFDVILKVPFTLRVIEDFFSSHKYYNVRSILL